MGLRDSSWLVARTQTQVRNGAMALAVQFISLLLTIIGITEIRKAVEASNVDMDRSDDLIPWLTAIVVMFCLAVVGADAIALYVILKDLAAGSCQKVFGWMLHGFMWFSTIFISLCTVTLVVGYVVRGLGNSGLLENATAADNVEVFYGLQTVELRNLAYNIDGYISGAWMVLIGAFMSIPCQAWMLTAMSVQLSLSEARQTVYKGGGSKRGNTAFYQPSTPDGGNERLALLSDRSTPGHRSPASSQAR